MKQSILFSLVLLLISGCGTSNVEIKVTETPAIPKSLATNTPFPTETPLPLPSSTQLATLEPEQIIFQDNFNAALNTGWQWLNEDSANWSLQNAPGSLQINVGKGYLNLGNASNILLIPAPEGNFEIETRLTFVERSIPHFAGLLLYESGENFIQVGHGYCKPVNGCVGTGIYFEEYSQGKLLQESYLAQKYNQESVSLRLIYKDGVLTFLSSPNGLAWYRINESNVKFNILHVGLIAGQNSKDPSPVLFDYFKVKALK